MAKQLFGNLITYKGKNLATAKDKAVAGNGNLVFAEIIEGADKGFYIFANGAEGHMVDMATFRALKTQVEQLIKDLPTNEDGTLVSIVDYVSSRISAMGNVMEFKGVVDTVPADANVTLTDGTTFVAKVGDVVTISSTDKDNGAEYVYTSTGWVEIGHVGVDEAVTSLGGVKGDVVLGTALSMTDHTLDVKLAAEQGNVTLDITDGLKASVAAKDLAYSAVFTVKNPDGTTSDIDFSGDATVANVKAALDDLYHGTRVTSEAIVDINTRLDGHDGDIKDINTAIEDINKTIEELDKVAVVDGDADDFVTVRKDPAENGDVTYTVSNVVAAQPTLEGYEEGKAPVIAAATGLATDAYVAAAIANALAWEVLSDEAQS